MAKTAPSKGPSAAARQLAQVFGPCLTRSLTGTSDPTTPRRNGEWAISLVELLIHAHDSQPEKGDQGDYSRCIVSSPMWEISNAFQQEIRDGVIAYSTPKRSSYSTPRRSTRSTSVSAARMGTSKRKLAFTVAGSKRVKPPYGVDPKSPSLFAAIQASTRSFEEQFGVDIRVRASSPNYVLKGSPRANSSDRDALLNEDKRAKKMRIAY
ncbi:MAG: hypothetical protein SGCHY_001277 [Lobulomycetales sp.]